MSQFKSKGTPTAVVGSWAAHERGIMHQAIPYQQSAASLQACSTQSLCVLAVAQCRAWTSHQRVLQEEAPWWCFLQPEITPHVHQVSCPRLRFSMRPVFSMVASVNDYSCLHNCAIWQFDVAICHRHPAWSTQHSKAQHGTAQHGTARHITAQHSTAQHSTAQHSTAQHSTAQHSTAQHSTAQHSTAGHLPMALQI